MNHPRTKAPAPADEEPELTPERDIPTDDSSAEEPPEDDESVAGEEDPGAAMEPP